MRGYRQISQREQLQSAHLPAPDGINVADPAGTLGATDAICATNLIRGQYGLRPRLGYREWVTGLGSAVKTIVPYSGSDSSKDKLFACTASGIYDCTSSTSTPSKVYSFLVATGDAGLGVFSEFQTAAGSYLCLCDEENGYILYTESTNTWAAVALGDGTGGTIKGVDPATLVYVTPWKNRLWFVARDKSIAYYLATGAITGDLSSSAFEFGNRLRYGGSLVGLWSWSIDGGQGIDDYLVGISSCGDVIVYQGTDPSNPSSSFALRGVWYVGAVPAGRRIATDIGGDLLILTALGVVPLSRIVSGGEKLDAGVYTTRKIGPLFNDYMEVRKASKGWDLRTSPEENALLVLIPYRAGQAYEQLAMELGNKGWTKFSGLPATCADVWGGKLYIGTSEGTVEIHDGNVDGLLLDGTGSVAINWSMLSSFQSLGTGRMKRVSIVKPDFITAGDSPTYAVSARYDYDTTALPSSTTYETPTSGTWGTDCWDTGYWCAGTGVAGKPRGTSGVGRTIALALNGSSMGEAAFVGATVMWQNGGAM